MELPRYQISTNEDQTVFWFTSEGVKGNVIKIALYTQMNEPGLYNLALGDVDPITEQIDFDNITNNGDRDKVLTSVASTVYAFFSKNPNTIIHFKGSDEVRTRLYQMAINTHYDNLKEDFEIFGKLNNEILRFNKGINFQAFLIQLKNY